MALLNGCAAGDPAALESFYRLTSPALFARVLQLVRDRGLAEEVLQDTYVAVWRHAASFDPARSSPLTWATAIARYRAIGVLRARRREVPEGEAESMADPSPSPLDETMSAAASRRLRACLDELDSGARRCLLLAFYRGYSHGEVAATLGQPLGTVKSWIRRSLLRLKRCLDA